MLMNAAFSCSAGSTCDSLLSLINIENICSHRLFSFFLLASAASRSRCTLLIGLYHSITSGLFRCSAFVQNQNPFADELLVLFLSVFMAIKSYLILSTMKKKLSRSKKKNQKKNISHFSFCCDLDTVWIHSNFLSVYLYLLHMRRQAGGKKSENMDVSIT